MFYLGLESTLYGFQMLILKFVDGEKDLRNECEVRDYNKLNLYLVDSNLVRFLKNCREHYRFLVKNNFI